VTDPHGRKSLFGGGLGGLIGGNTPLSDKLAVRRIELIAAREGLDALAKREREARERARILGGIKAFFALN